MEVVENKDYDLNSISSGVGYISNGYIDYIKDM